MHLIAQRRKKRIDALNPNADIDAEDVILDAVFDEEDLRTDLFQETANDPSRFLTQAQAGGRLSRRFSSIVPNIHIRERVGTTFAVSLALGNLYACTVVFQPIEL